MAARSEMAAASRRPPLGVYILTLTYACLALLCLLLTLLAIPTAHAEVNGPVPIWDTWRGPVRVFMSVVVLVSSVATLRGSRLGRNLLTVTLAVLVLGILGDDPFAVPQLCEASVGALSCSLQGLWHRIAWRELKYWLPWLGWFLLHCWYFYGPRTRAYYTQAENA